MSHARLRRVGAVSAGTLALLLSGGAPALADDGGALSDLSGTVGGAADGLTGTVKETVVSGTGGASRDLTSGVKTTTDGVTKAVSDTVSSLDSPASSSLTSPTPTPTQSGDGGARQDRGDGGFARATRDPSDDSSHGGPTPARSTHDPAELTPPLAVMRTSFPAPQLLGAFGLAAAQSGRSASGAGLAPPPLPEAAPSPLPQTPPMPGTFPAPPQVAPSGGTSTETMRADASAPFDAPALPGPLVIAATAVVGSVAAGQVGVVQAWLRARRASQ